MRSKGKATQRLVCVCIGYPTYPSTETDLYQGLCTGGSTTLWRFI